MARHFLVILVGIYLGTSGARAQTKPLPPVDKGREEALAQRAKERQYPGGSDESDLVVQTPLPVATRKMSPTVEIEAPEVSSDAEAE